MSGNRNLWVPAMISLPSGIPAAPTAQDAMGPGLIPHDAGHSMGIVGPNQEPHIAPAIIVQKIVIAFGRAPAVTADARMPPANPAKTSVG